MKQFGGGAGGMPNFGGEDGDDDDEGDEEAGGEEKVSPTASQTKASWNGKVERASASQMPELEDVTESK